MNHAHQLDTLVRQHATDRLRAAAGHRARRTAGASSQTLLHRFRPGSWSRSRVRPRAVVVLTLAAVVLAAPHAAAPATADVTIAAIGARFAAATRTLIVNGDAQGNTITVGRTAAGAIRVNGGAVPISGGTPTATNTNLIRINGLGGDDTMSLDELGGALPATAMSGGEGKDALTGGNRGDQLNGGPGDDLVDGNGGADTVVLGAGADRFVWNAEDGNDDVQGSGGSDTLLFNGSTASERVALSALDGRLQVTRDVANVEVLASGIETVSVPTRSGTDRVDVNKLTGTGVLDVDISLGTFAGGVNGDGNDETVAVLGTPGADDVQIVGTGNTATVLGLTARIDITGIDSARDTVFVLTDLGADRIDAGTLPDSSALLTLDGGEGDGNITGGAATT